MDTVIQICEVHGIKELNTEIASAVLNTKTLKMI